MSSERAEPASSPGLRLGWVVQGLAAATILVYAGALGAPFAFDDFASIVDNATLTNLWSALFPPGQGVTVQGRPLLNLSFALNRAITGTDPAGFRAVNVLIHLGAGLLLLGLVRRTLQQPRLAPRYGTAALPLAAAIAAIWTLHPLQTESVTYIVQRAESLAGLLYLATLYAFVRSVQPGAPRGWQILAATVCLLGMAAKETMVSAPLLVLLYDRFFVADSWAEVWRRRGRFHSTLFATWILLAFLVLTSGGRGGTATASFGLDLTGFWATQPRAIATYLKLSFLPFPLIIDYGTWPVEGAMDVVPQALLVVALLGGTAWAFRRGHPIAFCGIWFFALLSPTSLVPIPRQTVAEHRMYLALAPVAIALVLTLHRRIGRAGILGAAAAVLLGVITHARNRDYESATALWTDTVEKKPDNPWARGNLGRALARAGRHEPALAQFEAGFRLQPLDPEMALGAGNSALALDRPAEAIRWYEESVRLSPEFADAWYNLGLAQLQSARAAEAVVSFGRAVASEPGRAEFHGARGLALARSGRPAEAAAELGRALQIRPAYPEASYNLGSVHLQLGRWTDAADEFRRVIAAEPDRAGAHASLAIALVQLGRIDDATGELQEAARLEPASAAHAANLGALYRHQGRTEAARAAFVEALRLDPANAAARQGLAELDRK